ncbi:MAG TPA: preprotein translocase subunit YajC [Opitutae bacterium]|nr:preprotein translocase subunit YajC [Opitutae bacterium]|tara:strand:- start:377 stop:691 length:315 start_codon:yes stop_codon:yes gene_type:complete
MSTTELHLVPEFLAMGQPGGDPLGGILPMILIFVAFWFLLIAPQRKKQKQHEKMIQALEKGSKVKTIGGVFGTITGVKDDRFVLRISESVKVEVAKEAVAARVD